MLVLFVFLRTFLAALRRPALFLSLLALGLAVRLAHVLELDHTRRRVLDKFHDLVEFLPPCDVQRSLALLQTAGSNEDIPGNDRCRRDQKLAARSLDKRPCHYASRYSERSCRDV